MFIINIIDIIFSVLYLSIPLLFSNQKPALTTKNLNTPDEDFSDD